MEGVTWLGSLVLLLPLTGLAAWLLFRGGEGAWPDSSFWRCSVLPP